MDLEAILERRPQVVLVDELAHTNIEGSVHRKRYEDVMDLLAAKIDVLSTMNVQHIESLGPSVAQISGVQVREAVPDWLMQRVDEIVLADVTPQALQKRMSRGDIYPIERAERSLAHFFNAGNLIALRELALRQVTQVVDRSLDAHLAKEQSETTPDVRERIAVCISSNPAAQYLIARGFAHGACDQGRTLCRIHRHRPGQRTAEPTNLGRECAVCGESGRDRGADDRQECCRRSGQIRAGKTYHAGDLRALRSERMEEISLSYCNSALPS